MGASSSTGTHEQESLASAALALSLLHAAHSRSAASANALPDALTPPRAAFRLFGSSPPAHLDVLLLLARLGPAVASHFFGHREGADAGWPGFLKGFNRCCARVPASQSLALLLRVYAVACADAGAPCGVQFQPSDSGDHPVAKSSPRRKRAAPSVAKSLPTTPLPTAARLHRSLVRRRVEVPTVLAFSLLPSRSTRRHESRLARMREGERIRGYAGCRGEREFYRRRMRELLENLQ